MPSRTNTKTSNSSPQASPQKKSSPQASPKVAHESATRHVGRTLESDPEYYDQPARELAPAAGLIDPHGNDLTASPDMRDERQRVRDEFASGESLKTRLPGDTSSDPHTDLGPDHAGNVDTRKSKKRAK